MPCPLLECARLSSSQITLLPPFGSSSARSNELTILDRPPIEAVASEGSPGGPPAGFQRLNFDGFGSSRLTHYLFRFPAKFHPPVAHTLLRSYTSPGETVLDPFCGSGTLLVAAKVDGRHSVGSDVDPVAVFVAKTKAHRFRPGHLRKSWEVIRSGLKSLERPDEEYQRLRFDDITESELQEILADEGLWIPDIPNLFHWFRKYVVVDLARILDLIQHANVPITHREFFRLIFASIIRRSSNADPVPVSGLEVTAHMKRLDAAGRSVNPYRLFLRASERALSGVQAYWEASSSNPQVSVFQADATLLSSKIRRRVDAVITSPPYHNAVDYYRRHKLEMFWLGYTANQNERLELLSKYIGRPNVRKGDHRLQRNNELGDLSSYWNEQIRATSERRADAFIHYITSMKDVFQQLAEIVRKGGPVVFVLGNSQWNGNKLPTADLFLEIASDSFDLEARLWYPVKNRYMSYGRRNGADIDQEFVLVFRRSYQ